MIDLNTPPNTPPRPSSGQVPSLPAEVVDRVMYFARDNHTLFNLILTSKLFCKLSAVHLYRHLVITSSDDILLDTGLSETALDLRKKEDQDSGRSIKDTCRGKYTHRYPVRDKTVKASFLDLIRTVTIHPCRPKRRAASISFIPSNYRKYYPASTSFNPSTYRKPHRESSSAKAPSSNPMASLPSLLRIRCERLTLQLDTSSPDRQSPLPSLILVEDGNVHIDALLAALRPRQLVIFGAGFHQTVDPTTRLPPPLLLSVRQSNIILTPDAHVPGQAGLAITTRSDIGLALITKCIIAAFQLDRPPSAISPRLSSLPGPVDIRIVVSTDGRGSQYPPLLRFPPEPTLGFAVAHAPAAPGWMQGVVRLTAMYLQLARRIATENLTRKDGELEQGARGLGIVTFVNFGSFDRAQIGMWNASERDVEAKFEEALRWWVGIRADGLTIQSSKDWLKFETL